MKQTKQQPLFNGTTKTVMSFSNDIAEVGKHQYVPSFGGKISHELTRLIDLKRNTPLLSFADCVAYMVELHNEKYKDNIVLNDQLKADTIERYKQAIQPQQPKENVTADNTNNVKSSYVSEIIRAIEKSKNGVTIEQLNDAIKNKLKVPEPLQTQVFNSTKHLCKMSLSFE